MKTQFVNMYKKRIFIIFLIFSAEFFPLIGCAGIKPIIELSKSDSIWIVELSLKHSDLNVLGSKIIYSNDNFLEVCQLIGNTETESSKIITTVRYICNNQLVEKTIEEENEAPLRAIYKIKSELPVYLFIKRRAESISGEYQLLTDFKSDSISIINPRVFGNFPIVVFKTNLFYILKDSIVNRQIEYPTGFNNTNYIESIFNTPKICPEPFFKYNQETQEISYLQVVKVSNEPIVFHINTGSLILNDTIIKSQNDSDYFVPDLNQLKETLSIKDTLVGNLKIHITKKREFGIGQDWLLSSGSMVEMKINNQKIEAENLEDELGDQFYQFDYKIQNDSNLIIKSPNIYNAFRGGECGSCSYDTDEFWMVNSHQVKRLFSITRSSRNLRVGYILANGESKNFFLDTEDEDTFENGYGSEERWVNSNTYEIKIYNDKCYRIYLIHFKTLKGRENAVVEKGEVKCNK